MWAKAAVVLVLALAWAGPTGAAGAPAAPFSPNSATIGPVELTAGDSDSTTIRAGQPALDFRHTGAGGLAPGMVLVIGDTADPSSDHAFALTNVGNDAVQVRLHYAYDRQPPGDAGVQLAAYDRLGTALTDAAGQSDPSFELRPGASGYVVVTIRTHGATPRDDLSGSIEFTVVAPD